MPDHNLSHLMLVEGTFQRMPQEVMINGLTATSYTDSQGDIKTNLKLSPDKRVLLRSSGE